MDKRVLIALCAMVVAVLVLDALAFIGYRNARMPQSEDPGVKPAMLGVTASLFTAGNCSPCEAEKAFLDSLKPDHPGLAIREYDIRDPQAAAKMHEDASRLGFKYGMVPVVVVGGQYYVGFDGADGAGSQIEALIKAAERGQGNQATGGNETVRFIQFWVTGCPHCKQEKEDLLPILAERYPQVRVELYDLGQQAAVDMLQELADNFGFAAQSTPITVITDDGYTLRDYYYVGYGEYSNTGKKILGMLDDALAIKGGGTVVPRDDDAIEDIPLIGKVNLKEVSLPLFTMVLGLVDGFNPCAFFVLCFLLTLLIYAKSRKKMLAIGLTFVFVSGLAYFLFMAAWLNFFLLTGGMTIVTVIGGAIAILLGVINFKEFFFLGKGDVSTTISAGHKKDLFARMRGLVKSNTFAEILVGTIVLAIVANTYELLCTVGLPMIYTKALTMHGLDTLGYYLYLALYNLFYVMPLMAIVIAFAWTLGAKRISKGMGEALKLISGLMMLRFGLTLIIAPGLMTDLGYTVTLIGTSIVLGVAGWKLKEWAESQAPKPVTECGEVESQEDEGKTLKSGRGAETEQGVEEVNAKDPGDADEEAGPPEER